MHLFYLRLFGGGILNRSFFLCTFTQLLSKFCRPSVIEVLQYCLNGSLGLQSHKLIQNIKNLVNHQSGNPKLMFQGLHQKAIWLLLFFFKSKFVKLLWEDICSMFAIQRMTT